MKIYGVLHLKRNRVGINGDHTSSELNTDGEIMNELEFFVNKLQ